jgi:type II secretory pathway component PulF
MALCIFTNRFASLAEEGISFVEILSLLEDAPQPYGDDSKRLRALIQSGASIASAMEQKPELYSPYYIFMIRAGETGGIVEALLRRASTMLAKEWKLTARCQQREAPFFFANVSKIPQPENWESLSLYRRTTIQLLFCETLGEILSAGAPILRSLDIVRWLLPQIQRERLDEIKASIMAGEPMNPARLGMLPSCIAALLAKGEMDGTLNSTLLRAAEILENELDLLALE